MERLSDNNRLNLNFHLPDIRSLFNVQCDPVGDNAALYVPFTFWINLSRNVFEIAKDRVQLTCSGTQ